MESERLPMAATPWKQRAPTISKLAWSRPEPLGRIVIFGSGLYWGHCTEVARRDINGNTAARPNDIPPDKTYPLQLTCSEAHYGVCVHKQARCYETLDSMAIEIEHHCKKGMQGQILRFHEGAEGASASSEEKPKLKPKPKPKGKNPSPRRC